MKVIKLPSLRVAVGLYLPDERDKFERDNGEKLDNDIDGACCAHRIWVGHNGIGLLVHEVTHCAIWIITDFMHIDLDSVRNSELMSSIVEYIVKESVKYMAKKGCYDEEE